MSERRTVGEIRTDWQAAEGTLQEFVGMFGTRLPPSKEHSDKGILLARIADLQADVLADQQRIAALEAERDASQAHAARLAAALQEIALDEDGCYECGWYHGAHQPTCELGNALAATPADSLARQQAERAVVEAARAWKAAERVVNVSLMPEQVSDYRQRARTYHEALSRLNHALAALDAGEGRDG